MASLHLRRLFADDPNRGERLTLEPAGVYLDYSKNRVTAKTLALLVQLAEGSGLRQRIEAMFRGKRINVSENRAVLHTCKGVTLEVQPLTYDTGASPGRTAHSFAAIET